MKRKPLIAFFIAIFIMLTILILFPFNCTYKKSPQEHSLSFRVEFYSRVFELDAPDVDAGHQLFRRDLNTYHECRISDEWGGVEIIKRPEWARKQDMYV